ncbi:MAG: diterpene synthase [Chloroflexota bacterium]
MTPGMISLEEFQQLSAAQVAQLIRSHGAQVCVFPFNGTRRWFLLEHGSQKLEDPAKAYIDLTGKRYIAMYRMLFDHGLDTVLAPVFGGDILGRGDEYMQQIGVGMRLLTDHPDFLSFYDEYGVRVHFYGDYRKALCGTPYAYLSDLFDGVTKRTASNTRFRLFYGVFGSDATETIAELSIQHYQQTGRIPTRQELIEFYYGEQIEKANIFIGFEKFTVFDYPMLGNGEESLYFTAAPSLYMNERQLRDILYDHLYLRSLDEPDYSDMTGEDIAGMHRYYQRNRGTTFGVGKIHGKIWYSNPEIRG